MPRKSGPHFIARLIVWFRKWTRDLSNRSMAICLAVGCAASLILFLKPPVLYDFLSEQETRLQDQFFVWRNELARTLGYRGISADDIVIIGIDEDSAAKLGAFPPWPRQIYAELVDRLNRAGARLVAFDLNFQGPSRLETGAAGDWTTRLKDLLPREHLKKWQESASGDDWALAHEMESMKSVVLATNVELTTNLFHARSQYRYYMPYDLFVFALGNRGALGNVVTQPDRDGVVRRASLVYDKFAGRPPFSDSFGLKVAEMRWGSAAIRNPGGRLFLSDRYYPTILRLNFVGPSGTIKTIPIWKVLAGSNQKVGEKTEDLSALLRDKIVLVGYQLNTQQEEIPAGGIQRLGELPLNLFLTPVSSVERPMSSVELQANIIANILSSRYLSEPAWWEQTLITAFVSLLLARIFSGLHGRPWSMLATVLCFGLIWLIDAFLCFVYLDCLIPVIIPIFGVALPSYFLVLMDQNLFAFKERRRHTEVFRALTSSRVSEEIDRRQLGELGLEGKRAQVTILLCELDELTTQTEGESAEDLIRLLNECINAMTASVYEHSGIVMRIWNNGVMALWGAPLGMREESQGRLAAGCCMEIRERLARLEETWGESQRLATDSLSLKSRFAINSGTAVCGRIKTENHTEYGAFGQTVEVLMRLDTLNKRYETTCIIGEPTAELVREQFETRELDTLRLEPGQKPLRIYELLGKKGKVPGVLEESTALYRQALNAMEERNFEEADKLFSAALRIVPTDRPTILMQQRCRQFMANPPEPNWDGATLIASD